MDFSPTDTVYLHASRLDLVVSPPPGDLLGPGIEPASHKSLA